MQEVLKDYRATLVHSDIVLSSDLSANLIWLETFIKTLDNMDANLHRFSIAISQLFFTVSSSRFHVALSNIFDTFYIFTLLRLPCSVRRYKHGNYSKSLDMLQLLLLDYTAVDFVAQR